MQGDIRRYIMDMNIDGVFSRAAVICIICVAFLSTTLSAFAGPDGKDLRRVISNENPLFVYSSVYAGASSSQLLNFRRMLPDDVRPYFAVHINPKKEDSKQTRIWIESILDTAQELDMPAIIEVEGFDSRNDTPMSYWRELFDRYHVLIGLNISELGATGVLSGSGMDNEFIDKMIQYIDVAASKGGYFIWQDMGYDWPFPKKPHVFLKAGADRRLYAKFVEDGDHIILVHKHNGNGRRSTTDAAAIGFWASGLTSNWGVHSEGWLWWEAGNERLFGPSAGYTRSKYPWKSVFSFPDAQYGMEWLMAAVGGATIFSLETYFQGYSSCKGDMPTPAFENVLLPMIRLIINNGIIPGRKQALAKIKAAYQPLKPNDYILRKDLLFKGLYGAEKNTQNEWLPSTGRYYYLPVLPVLAGDDIRAKFPFVFNSDYYRKNFKSIKKKQSFFNRLYPETSKGDSWIVNFGTSWYIVNPNENKNVTTTFEFTLKNGDGASLSGSISHHTYAVVEEKPDSLIIHVGNYMIDSDADVWDNPDFPDDNPCEYVDKRYIPNPTDDHLRTSRFKITGLNVKKPEIHVEIGKNGNFDISRNSNNATITINHNGTAEVVISLQ